MNCVLDALKRLKRTKHALTQDELQALLDINSVQTEKELAERSLALHSKPFPYDAKGSEGRQIGFA